ncbi:jg7677 [Pararge aegeria aegeria]|uniref:Jg7677 protein n=1 Tax=Pararge aegeria aegeria TaxID=348720 RepID=A0A8S4S2R0_9NEOP|nr:jg7677 [Pararge aegeria aegeria]
MIIRNAHRNRCILASQPNLGPSECSAGVVHYSFLKSGGLRFRKMSATANHDRKASCQTTEAGQSLLATAASGHARPQTEHQTATNPEELALECLRHLPYSNLAPIDYNFFRNLDNFCKGIMGQS